jgi:predicted MPP superfamily phosphohydrolase
MSRPLQFAIFFSIMISLVAGLHYYFWARLVRDTALAAPWRTIATLVIAGLAIALPASIIGSRLAPAHVAGYFAYPAFVWMGAMFLLFCVLLGSDVLRVGGTLVARLVSGTPLDPARRQFIARTIGAASALAASGLTAAAIGTVLRGPRLEKVEIPIDKLPAGADGLRIVQLTDIHVGPTIGREFIEELVRRTNALEPDVVAITGDLVDGSVAELGPLVAPLAGLRAKHGVFFVTGNHEYYSGAPEWVAFLPTLGIRVLRNERVSIGAGEAAFDLAGVDDFSAHGGGHGPDLPRALAGRDESRALVLLAHQPRQIGEAERLGVDLQLSGHTHGGQIWPFSYLVYLQQPFLAGLARQGETWIYVSKGTGYWGPPMRLGMPSEITQITLRRGGSNLRA